MAKTRSQTGHKTIKKEEEEDCKSTLGLNNATVTTGNKIAKRKPAKNNKILLPSQQVKVEEDDDDTKLLLKPISNHSKLPKRPSISQEQITQLIDTIVNDKLGIYRAARRVKLSVNSARYYYNVYKNDPEKKIPLPRNQRIHSKGFLTEEHVENLIKYTDSLTTHIGVTCFTHIHMVGLLVL